MKTGKKEKLILFQDRVNISYLKKLNKGRTTNITQLIANILVPYSFGNVVVLFL